MENLTISSIKNKRLSKSTLVILIISLIFGLFYIALSAFQFSLVDTLTVFIIGFLLMLFFACSIGLVLVSLIYGLFKIEKERLQAFFPLIVNITIILIIIFVPFTNIWLDMEFHKNYDGYNEVVTLVKNGHINQFNSEGRFTKLPVVYEHLSRGGGEIMIDTTGGVYRVFFFSFRGILDNISGFMYRSDDLPPPPKDNWAEWDQIIKYADHWYFCASR